MNLTRKLTVCLQIARGAATATSPYAAGLQRCRAHCERCSQSISAKRAYALCSLTSPKLVTIEGLRRGNTSQIRVLRLAGFPGRPQATTSKGDSGGILWITTAGSHSRRSMLSFAVPEGGEDSRTVDGQPALENFLNRGNSGQRLEHGKQDATLPQRSEEQVDHSSRTQRALDTPREGGTRKATEHQEQAVEGDGGQWDRPRPQMTDLQLARPNDEATSSSAASSFRASSSGGQKKDNIGKESSLQQRVWGALRESGSAAYTAFVDNTLIALLAFLRVGDLLVWLTPNLRTAYAHLTGTWHHLQKGGRVSYSLVNNTSPHFEAGPGYDPAAFPHKRDGAPVLPDLDLRDTHFLSLCMKLAYEDPDVIQDIAESRWGWAFTAYWSTGPQDGHLFTDPSDRSVFVPRSRACMLTNENAIVIAFRGE
eukprot:jgi/Botrbrau1/22324/Bobra.0002s0004.1